MAWFALFFVIIICLFRSAEKIQVGFSFHKEYVFILLVLFTGLRYQVGIDYPIYEEIYNDPYSVHALALEPIWAGINDLLRTIGFRARGFFFLTSLIIVWGYYTGIRKISPDFYISILLFVVCGFYFESANIVRQYVATSVLFAGFPYFIKGKLKIYLLYVFIAVLFHYSAILVLPVIFLCKFRYPAWVGIIVLLFSYILGNNLLNLLVEYVMPSLSEISKYQYEVEDFDAGVNSGILQVFYNLLGIAVLLFYPRMNKMFPSLYVLVNMTILGVIFYNTFYLFMPARRLYLYFFPYLMLLFPYYLKGFSPLSRWIIVGVVISIFLTFLLKSNWMIHYDFDFLFF